jgi:hypothetical protein
MAEDEDIRRARAQRARIDTNAYYVRDPKTGLSPAQVEANQAVAEAAASTGKPVIPGATGASATADRVLATPNRYYNYFTGEYVDDPSKIKPRTGMDGAESDGGIIDTGQFQSTGKTIVSVTYEGTGKNRVKVTKYSDGTETREAASEDVPGSAPTIVSTYTDSVTGDVIAVYSDGSTKVLSKGTKAADAAFAAQTAAEDKRRKGQSAYDLLFAEFDRYGMGGLLNDVKQFIQDGLSKDELTLKLRATPAYQKRFAANAERIKKGFRAISEAEYIGLEDQYQNVMRQYGLPESYYTRGDMGVQQGFEKFIGGDVSAVELEDRIQTAQNRVINANPEVSKALREFYPEITGGDILAYALDPDKAITNIKRKVQAAEIGAGAMQAGLKTGLARAEELQRYGVTKETAQQGFGTIASGLERGRQLSNIYQQPDYTQQVAETEVFALPDADKARRQRRRLGQLETATFSGSTGMTGGALDRERAGQY